MILGHTKSFFNKDKVDEECDVPEGIQDARLGSESRVYC